MSKAHQVDRVAASRVRGFTMLEVLVSLVIIALTLLGTAGMQAYAMKMSQGGQLRTQAVILGMDILERIEANNEAAVAGDYEAATLPSVFPTDCYTLACTATALATFDLVQFQAILSEQLPSASATIALTALSGSGPWVYTVQINWVERITRSATTAVTTTGPTTVTGAGQTESFSYTLSRTVYNRFQVM
jgi:type IV pilus assembly protein PilV